jgi:hypothetical protein
MSAYQASSKTLTFWVVAIVFFVSAVVGQAQTPQALSAASYVARGVDLYKKGELDRAMADLNIALTFDARCDQAYVLRGLVKKDRGDLSGALGDFERADGNQACMCSADLCPVRVCGCLCRSGKRLFVRTASGPLEPLLPQTGRKRRSALHGSVF